MVIAKKANQKKSLFKKGHAAWNKQKLEDNPTLTDKSDSSIETENSSSICPSSSNSDTESSIFVRPPKTIFEEAVRTQANWAGCKSNDVIILPSKLRPRKQDDEYVSGVPDQEQNENVIVNVMKLSELIAVFLNHTSCTTPQPAVEIYKRSGLCITVTVSCKQCSFVSQPVEMFQRIPHPNKPGVNPGMLNEAVAIPVVKTKCGAGDVAFMLACLNIKPPSMKLICQKVNGLSDTVTEMNEQSMVENQKFVKDVNNLLGHDEYVDVETDTSYNNRPQAGGEAATQSFTPLVELNTTQKRTLSLDTKNKLCNKRKFCEHQNESCKKNYCDEESISSSEAKSAKKNLEKVNSGQILKINSVTCDASAQLSKTVREVSENFGYTIRHYTCFIHKMRTLQKNVKNMKLNRTPPNTSREIFLQRLATCIRARVRLELVRIKKRYLAEELFCNKAMAAVENIVPCFSGRHRNCQKNSMVCIAHLASYTTKFLPYGKHLDLISEDEQKLTDILNKSLSFDVLHKISRLLNTNKSESLHHRVFTYAPKNTVWSRNFSALCHSAVHSATFGTGRSALLIAKKIGVKYSKRDPMFWYMVKRDDRDRSYSLLKKTPHYKLKRYNSRKKKCQRITLPNEITE